MKNYIFIVKSEGFNVHQFVRNVLGGKIIKEQTIELEDFILTQHGYFIHEDVCYQLYANVVKDNINYICAVNSNIIA